MITVKLNKYNIKDYTNTESKKELLEFIDKQRNDK